MLGLRLLYLAFLCPYTLVEDEAFYWEWSRRLDLSYYTKGPGVAWTIALFTTIFGNTEFAVRAAAPLCAAVAMLAVAALTRDVSRPRGAPIESPGAAARRAGFFAALCLALAPMFQATGLLMTIDGPYAMCWALACWAAWRMLFDSCRGAWLAFGLCLGVGFLYKYTALVLLPSVLIAALAGRGDLRMAARWPVWALLGAGVMLLAASPVIIWNQREGWPTVAHLLGHLGVRGGDMPVTQGAGGWHYDPKWTAEFLLSQAGMIGPVLFIAAIGAWRSFRGRAGNPHTWRADRFLLALCAPLLLLYIGVSFIAEPEGNWALAAYLSACGLAGRQLVRGMDAWAARLAAWRALPAPRPRAGFFVKRPETPTQVLWTVALVLGIGMAVLGARLDVLSSGLEALKASAAGGWIPEKASLPIGRFTGADRMGAHAGRLLEEVRAQTGQEPFLVGVHYGRAAQLAFYTPGRPVVICTSSVMTGGRRTQYDYWPDTNPVRRTDLAGRPAIMVGPSTIEPWHAFFERVELVGRLEGDGKRDRPAYRGEGCRGFAAPGAQGAFNPHP